MKILGREIKVRKVFEILINNPLSGSVGAFNYLRQKIFLDGIFKGGYSLPPTIIVIEVTYKCNLRCKTCWFYGNSGIIKDKKIEEGLNFKQLKKLVDEVAWFRPYIYLTGGEPLINKNSVDFINYAKRKGLVVGIVTNGTLLTKENSERLINIGLDFITVSIDGPEKIHNKIRGFKCFEKSMEGIKNILEIRRRKNKKFPVVTLNCTISDYNYEYLEEIVNIGENLGVDIIALQHPCFLLKKTIKAHHAVFKSLFKTSENLVNGFENDSALKIDVQKLYKIIDKIKKKKKNVDLRLFQDFPFEQMKDYYEKEIATNNRCINPWYSATIKPNGDVSPCLGYVVGNINDGSFMKIWNNQKFRSFRKILKQKKYFPGCIRCCAFFLNFKKQN